MAITTVLVHLDTGEATRARLETAIALVRDHGARLIGLHIRPVVDIRSVAQAYVGTNFIAEQERVASETAARIEAEFLDRAERAGVTAEWRCEKGDVYDLVARHARYVDVAIVGQTPPNDPEGLFFLQIPEQVALTAGRPVIVVPYIGGYPEIGKRVVVAWNGSREATRAVHDALPILEKAQRVVVLSIDPGERRHIPGADIAALLARHGVRAEASETSSGEIRVGDVLLSRAADLSADLIVMGAYGHSRAREWVTGGVTRHLLAHMTVPVLMSH